MVTSISATSPAFSGPTAKPAASARSASVAKAPQFGATMPNLSSAQTKVLQEHGEVFLKHTLTFVREVAKQFAKAFREAFQTLAQSDAWTQVAKSFDDLIKALGPTLKP